MEEKIIKVDYKDLDEKFKDQVRENFREDEFLVPDDWWHWEFEDFEARFPGFEIDVDSAEFDIYRNDFNWNGTIDLSHKEIESKIPQDYFLYTNKEWLYDVSEQFKNAEMERDYYIPEDEIFDQIEMEIFPSDVEAENGKIELSIEKFRPAFEAAIENYSDFPDEVKQLETWLNEMVAVSDMFFQDVYVIEEEDYDNLLENLRTEIVRLVENFMEIEFYPDMDSLVSDVYDTLADNLKGSYDYYYEDEYADQQLADKTFEVEVDDEGNQLEVIDLNGEW